MLSGCIGNSLDLNFISSGRIMTMYTNARPWHNKRRSAALCKTQQSPSQKQPRLAKKDTRRMPRVLICNCSTFPHVQLDSATLLINHTQLRRRSGHRFPASSLQLSAVNPVANLVGLNRFPCSNHETHHIGNHTKTPSSVFIITRQRVITTALSAYQVKGRYTLDAVGRTSPLQC